MIQGLLKERMRRNSIRIFKYISIHYSENSKKLFSPFDKVSTKGRSFKCQQKLQKGQENFLKSRKDWEQDTSQRLLKTAWGAGGHHVHPPCRAGWPLSSPHSPRHVVQHIQRWWVQDSQEEPEPPLKASQSWHHSEKKYHLTSHLRATVSVNPALTAH